MRKIIFLLLSAICIINSTFAQDSVQNSTVIKSANIENSTKDSLQKKAVKKAPKAKGNAQDSLQDNTHLKSLKGENYLPETKDWAVGFDLIPVFYTFAKMIPSNSLSPTITGTGGITNYILGKYFKNPKTAYRIVVGINAGSVTNKKYVNDTNSLSIPKEQVLDKQIISNYNIVIGGGIEKRRGKTRLQGYYGALAMITFGGGKTTYKYGNEITQTNQSLTSGFGQPTGLISYNAGTTVGFKLNGFVGAEYFIMPKVSLGAEYWWGVGYSQTSDGKENYESWDITNNVPTHFTKKTGGKSTFDLGAQYATGAKVFLNLHF